MSDIKALHNGIIYLVKDEIKESCCEGCALADVNCERITYADGRNFSCGTNKQIIIEDTPEAIMEYLEVKLNGYEEEDE